ncbi:MAG: PhzF family phenazine biosynthesis protein [Fimbriimonas sp.]
MAAPIYIVDAFAESPFTGNPAGVCFLDAYPGDEWLQAVAMEMNHAETAFLVPRDEDYELRWFTPAIEVDLCGHATLASAHSIFERGYPGAVIRFHTRSGVLTAVRGDDEIELDFPSEAPTEASLPHALPSLGVAPVWTGKNRMDWFVQLPDADDVRRIEPDFREIAALGIRGLIVTAHDASGEFDFVSRGFFPQSGIDEDPVTGSAHCAFAPFWAERLGKTEMVGYQASRRGGRVGVRLEGDRVKLLGRAVTTLAGTLAC